MKTNPLLRRGIVVIIITLLLTLAFAPSINANKVKVSNKSGEPELIIESIYGGINVTVVFKNIGDEDVVGIDWNILVRGGILGMVDVNISGSIERLIANETAAVRTPWMGIFHIGPIRIDVTAEAENVEEVVEVKNAFVFGPLILFW